MAHPTTDHSVLTSLASLMEMEHRRVEQEQENRRRAAEDEQRRIAAQAQAERDLAEQRAREAEAQTRAREDKLREDEARARAERDLAELRIRLEAERAARAENDARRAAHAERLAEIARGNRGRVSLGAAAAVVLGAVSILGAGAWFGIVQPAMASNARVPAPVVVTVPVPAEVTHAEIPAVVATNATPAAGAESATAPRRLVARNDRTHAVRNVDRTTRDDNSSLLRDLDHGGGVDWRTAH